MIIDTGVETDMMMSDEVVIVVMTIDTEKGDVARLLHSMAYCSWGLLFERKSIFFLHLTQYMVHCM